MRPGINKLKLLAYSLVLIGITLSSGCQIALKITRGTIEAGKYDNSSIDLSFELPEGWRYANQAELAYLNKGKPLPGAGEEYTEANFNAREFAFEMYAVQEASGDCASVVIAQASDEKADLEKFLTSIKTSLSSNENFKFGAYGTATVRKEEYKSLPCTYGAYESPIIRNYYARQKGGYFICIMTTLNGGDKDILIEKFM